MISHVEIIRRIHRERAYWKRQLQTDYEKGILLGLQLAITITQETRHDRDISKLRGYGFKRSAR